MASRSNKSSRSYGAPTGYTPPSTATAANRPQVGQGTRQQVRQAIERDRVDTAAGAQQMAAKRKKRTQQQQPAAGTDQATRDLSAMNAAGTIKKKQARDKKYIDEASR